MSGAMVDNVLIGSLLVVPIGLTIAVLWLPRWFFMSMGRHALWRLRDRLADDMLTGRLPKDHPAARELLGFVDWFTREARQLTMLRLYLWSRAWRRSFPDQETSKPAVPSSAGLDAEQRRLLQEHRDHARYLMLGTTLFGTWFGITTVVRFVPQALLEARRRAREAALRERRETSAVVEYEALVTIREATTRAGANSWIGHRASELIRREERELAGAA